MRRSLAPSIRQNCEAVISSNVSIINTVQNAEISSNSSVPKRPSTSSTDKLFEKENRFTVVYGRVTTKKHKTFENDGILEVTDQQIVLKDLNNRIVEQKMRMKSDDVNEGARIIMGGNEVELIDRCVGHQVPSPPCKRKTTSSSGVWFDPAKFKKFIPAKFVQHKNELKPQVAELNRLKFPAPSVEHQWKYNTQKLPVTDVYVPASLSEFLRPHQIEGVTFLYECIMGFRYNENGEYNGAILADEMGLGKTLQCITTCCTLLKSGPYGNRPVAQRILILAPSSLVENWDREIQKWLKNERFFTHIINSKTKSRNIPSHIPFVIVSYETFLSQFSEIEKYNFDIMVCDEGHRLKNSSIKLSKQLNQLSCKKRIILTGTPIQNDLHEFYTLINFVNPGILGEYSRYKKYYETPIVQSQQVNVLPEFRKLGEERARELNKIIQTFVLRRTSEINTSYLPKKQELVIFVEPTELQKYLVKSTLEYYENRTEKVSPLEVITILKKICNHPSLLLKMETESKLLKFLRSNMPPQNDMGPFDATKLTAVMCLLQSIREKKERIILISYSTKTLDMLQDLCGHLNYNWCRLDGTTPAADRNKIVQNFNKSDSNVFVFLLSAKAGGVGLNLIGASRLLLYDNDWNPASDLQALSRIWRDGQTRDVFIYRLITAATIEEKIYQRQISKTALSDCIEFDSGVRNKSNIKFSDAELRDLFSFDFVSKECSTHRIIECRCTANGEIPLNQTDGSVELEVQQSDEEEDEGYNHFRIIKKPQNIKQTVQATSKMSELMKWEHHKAPVAASILSEIDLFELSEEIQFIFRNQIQN